MDLGMMRGPRSSSSSFDEMVEEHNEQMGWCGRVHRVCSVSTMASDSAGGSDSGFEASEFEGDPVTAMDRQSSSGTEAAPCKSPMHHVVFSAEAMLRQQNGRSDSAFESEIMDLTGSPDRQFSDGAQAPPSKGSMNHPHACGPPCKYAAKASGCKDGANCTHCHLCRWERSAMRCRTSFGTFAPHSTDLMKMRHGIGPSETKQAQDKRRPRARARRRLSATEGDAVLAAVDVGAGYMSPGEEFWY